MREMLLLVLPHEFIHELQFTAAECALFLRRHLQKLLSSAQLPRFLSFPLEELRCLNSFVDNSHLLVQVAYCSYALG